MCHYRTRAKFNDDYIVTVSWPGTLTAQREDVRHFVVSSGVIIKVTSVKQEPNDILDYRFLYVQISGDEYG